MLSTQRLSSEIRSISKNGFNKLRSTFTLFCRQTLPGVGFAGLSTNSTSKFQQKTSRAMATQPQVTLTLDNLNPNIKVMENAVRGPLIIRAMEIEKELEKVTS